MSLDDRVNARIGPGWRYLFLAATVGGSAIFLVFFFYLTAAISTPWLSVLFLGYILVLATGYYVGPFVRHRKPEPTEFL